MSADAPQPSSPEAQPPGGQPRKGMSKGCMVALIVVGALLILIIAASVVCYIKRDDIFKGGLTMGINQVERNIINSEPQGIDTVWVANVVDAFNAQVEGHSFEELQTDPVAIQQLGEFLQAHAGDEQIDSAEAVTFVRTLIAVFPDELDQYRPPKPSADTAATDTTGQ